MRIRDVAIGANASIYYKLNFKRIKGVFYPRSIDDVSKALETARENGYEVTVKGGGSGLSGACTGGDAERIMISTLQMRKIMKVAPEEGFVDVEPGVTPDEINDSLAQQGYKFWVAPSSRDIATVGGILSTDGGGNDTWVNGTMRDNTIHVRMLLYDGTEIRVTKNGVESDSAETADALNAIGMNLDDVASSHGTLGFITQLRLAIRPIEEIKIQGALMEFDDASLLGKALDKMIDAKLPIQYGEAIVAAHEDVRDNLRPPLLILEYPQDIEDNLQRISNLTKLDPIETQKMKDIRIKLPKRNPKEGVQMALFEGYGFFGESLVNMQQNLEAIDDLLRRNSFEPFAKYGHGPSKWYLGNNEATYGLIMHSREIRPPNTSGAELFKVVREIVDLCDDQKITPKPEHKWIYSSKVKLARLRRIRSIVGDRFNSFIVDEQCNQVLANMA